MKTLSLASVCRATLGFVAIFLASCANMNARMDTLSGVAGYTCADRNDPRCVSGRQATGGLSSGGNTISQHMTNSGNTQFRLFCPESVNVHIGGVPVRHTGYPPPNYGHRPMFVGGGPVDPMPISGSGYIGGGSAMGIRFPAPVAPCYPNYPTRYVEDSYQSYRMRHPMPRYYPNPRYNPCPPPPRCDSRHRR